MRWMLVPVAFLFVSAQTAEAAPPLVEKYLHSGQLARGEQALLVALEKKPKNSQLRFGLGVLQFVRALERFGQALHEHGARADRTNTPFLRVPVPKNANPSALSYKALGRIFDVLIADLERAERTLAQVRKKKVKLRLRLAKVRFDLTGDGTPSEKFLDMLTQLNGGRIRLLDNNPDFLICFDRGDVAWLRAYCHLLSAMLEAYRSVDLEADFDKRVQYVFPKVEKTGKRGGVDAGSLVIRDGTRLRRFRTHMLAVCKLNYETWEYIRAETDDDHEWLPNPKQKGVLGLPVRDSMIDGWLRMVREIEAVLEGKRTFLKVWLGKNGQGLNLKVLFEDPPEKLVSDNFPHNLPDKYFSNAPDMNFETVMAVFQIFNDTTRVAYAAWFN